MFQNVVRAARPDILAAFSSLKPSTSTLRAFPTTFHIQSGEPPVPTNMEQATGLQVMGERQELGLSMTVEIWIQAVSAQK